MASRISRRRVLGAGAAWGSLALTSCASMDQPTTGRVVVIGGGYGGATLAKYLRMWSDGTVDVTLIERHERFVSCPMSNLVLTGDRSLDELTWSYGRLTQCWGVKRIRAEVIAIDHDRKQVRLEDGTRVPYDRVVVSPGVDMQYELVPALVDSDARQRVVHAWKAGPQTLALRRQMEAMPDGGVFAITIPKAPYRCPPGPYERACLVASYFKRHKPKSKVLVLDANPEIVSKKILFETVFREHYAGMIEYRPNNELRDVDVKTMTALLDFDNVKADVLNVIPPQRAADVAKNAGLISVNDRWVGVDWLTMESEKVKGVHVLGDAVFPAAAMPKSGHMANQHAKLAAASILAQLSDTPVNPRPLVMNTCYSYVNRDEAIHVASVHRYDIEKKTLLPVNGSGGVSAAPSALEGRYAWAWAQNIWADMLA
ncbi:MAG TPA: NAD(P)/FAD-dependent oxidoreductase [Burkholderiaceae bacterium]|nr:NAD(P)/FAD-dependent oxidoreductase [Burkholderiaceae bacterium]